MGAIDCNNVKYGSTGPSFLTILTLINLSERREIEVCSRSKGPKTSEEEIGSVAGLVIRSLYTRRPPLSQYA